jgi:hypothetical protein
VIFCYGNSLGTGHAARWISAAAAASLFAAGECRDVGTRAGMVGLVVSTLNPLQFLDEQTAHLRDLLDGDVGKMQALDVG